MRRMFLCTPVTCERWGIIEGIGPLGRGLRFAEVLQDSSEHGSNVLHGSF